MWGIRSRASTLLALVVGSPPRVWGIPPAGRVGARWTAVHPHACGEYVPNWREGFQACSVHPHACGEYVARLLCDESCVRFTPTRVGNTYHPSSPCLLPAVHPHACGEYDNLAAILFPDCRFTPTRVGNTHSTIFDIADVFGSPPRVWGIPIASGRAAWYLSVHPHACGEYAVTWTLLQNHWRFTPTRVGNTQRCHVGLCYFRFTPTRVGNTNQRRVGDSVLSVHPHACGEYSHNLSTTHSHVRFTPTRVGNTAPPWSGDPWSPVHPHACGEYIPPMPHPPLGRRFTPTRVGNTPIFQKVE